MNSAIKFMDFITIIPNFFYDGEYRYKTTMGGVIQIFLTLLWLTGIIFFSKDIYLRENPSIITSNEYDRIPYERNYTNLEDFMFMVSINDPITWAPFIDETYYTVKFTTMIKVNQSKGPSEYIKTERCRPEYFVGREDQMTGIPIENYYCMSPDINNVTFKGTQTSPDSKYIKFGVHMCINSTENNNFCKTPEEINEKLAGSSFNLFFYNYKFNLKNYTKPDELFVDFHHSFYSNLYYKLVFVTLKQVRFIDDVGFFTESRHSKDFYAVNDIKEVFNFKKQPDGKFLDFAVNFGTNRENVVRNYKKIQIVIAEVGGLFKGIFLSVILLRMLFMNEKTFEYLNYFIDNDKVFGISFDNKMPGNSSGNKNNLTKFKNFQQHKMGGSLTYSSSHDMVTNNTNNFQSNPKENQKILSTNSNNELSGIINNSNLQHSNLLRNMYDNNINLIKNSKFKNNSDNLLNENQDNSIANNSEMINIKNNINSKQAINVNNTTNPHTSLDNSNVNKNSVSHKNNEKIGHEEGKYHNKNHLKNIKEMSNYKFSNNTENNVETNMNKLKITDTNHNLNNFDKLKSKNTFDFYQTNKKFTKNFEVLARNYLSQKELLKLVTDFALLRSIIFDYEQNNEFEEMSRNLDLVTKVMIEKEVIFSNLLKDQEKNIFKSDKIDSSNVMLRLN